jgi:YebC/PmpR family DNA-binding regulatory protein
MSGHSKWASIKHKKGALDAKRGRIFTRIIKELTVAARAGGGDPDMNPRLRTIIGDAKAANMPAENIKRAIRRGTGEEPGVSYEEAQYEGYGPGGAAVIIDVLTDNKNRTAGEIRHLLEKWGGNLAAPNAVAWMFNKKGYIVVEKSKVDEEKLMNTVLEAGADDFQEEGDNFGVYSAPETFTAVQDAVKALGIQPVSAKVSLIPQNMLTLEGKPAQAMLKLMDALDDHDDVQNVSSNFDVSEKEIEASLA